MKRFLSIFAVVSILFLSIAHASFLGTGLLTPPHRLNMIPGALNILDPGIVSTITQSGGVASQLDDANGNGRNYSQGTAANQPTVVSNCIGELTCLDFDTNDQMVGVAGALDLLKNRSAYTVAVVGKFEGTGAAADALLATNNGSSARFLIGADSSNKYTTGGRRLDADGAVAVTSGISKDISDWHVMMVTVDHTNTILKVYEDGIEIRRNASYQTSGSTSNTNSGNIYLGSGGATAFFNGKIALVGVWDHVLTASEMDTFHRYAQSRYQIPVAHSGINKYIVLHGDSITAGFGLTAAQQLEKKLWQALGYLSNVMVVNYGTSGLTWNTMHTEGTNTLDNIAFPSTATKILVAWGGVNDINGGDSAATACSDASTYIGARNTAAKFDQIIVGSIITVNPNATATATYNASLLAGSCGTPTAYWNAAALQDAGADRFNTNALTADTTYYQADRIHPTAYSIGLFATSLENEVD